MDTFKAVVYSLLSAIVASLGTLFIAGAVLGFQFQDWPEIPSRVVGVLCTVAGVAGAGIGLALTGKCTRCASK